MVQDSRKSCSQAYEKVKSFGHAVFTCAAKRVLGPVVGFMWDRIDTLKNTISHLKNYQQGLITADELKRALEKDHTKLLSEQPVVYLEWPLEQRAASPLDR